MKKLDHVLFIISGILLLIGVISKVVGTNFLFWGPLSYWRAAVILILYAIYLLLTQMKDAQKAT